MVELDLASHPIGARDTDTSRDAAEALAPSVTALRKLTLDNIDAEGGNGLTGDEVAIRNGFPPHGLRPRISELRKMGLLFDSGHPGGSPLPHFSERSALISIFACRYATLKAAPALRI